LGFRVYDLRLKVEGLRFRVWVQGEGCRAICLKFWGLEFRVLDSGFGI
jgi:hypothetical protein